MKNIFLLIMLPLLAGCAENIHELPFEDKKPILPKGGATITEGYIERVVSTKEHDSKLNIEVIAITSNSATIRLPRSGEIFQTTVGHSFTNGLDLLKVDYLRQQITIGAEVTL